MSGMAKAMPVDGQVRYLVQDDNHWLIWFLEFCCLYEKYCVDAAVHLAVILDGRGG